MAEENLRQKENWVQIGLWQKDSIIYLGTLKRIRVARKKIRTVEFWYELTLDRSRDQAIQGFIVWTKNLLIGTMRKHCSILSRGAETCSYICWGGLRLDVRAPRFFSRPGKI